MTRHAALMFAVFASNERARAARAELADDGAQVELVASPELVTRRAEAARPLVRRLGLLLGLSLVAGFVIAALGALLLAAVGALPRPIPTELISAGVAVVLAAVLGGLAGGLAFTTRSQLEQRRLCALIERGHALLLFPARRGELGDRLRRFGAVQVGSLS